MPVPTPTPEPGKKDRISVGATQSKAPLILRKDEEIAVAKGEPNVAPPTPSNPEPTTPQQAKDGHGAPEVAGREGLRSAPGPGQELQRGQEGSKGRPGLIGPSLNADIDRLARDTLRKQAQLGIPTGTNKNIGGFSFDPQGADFTGWIDHARRELYRNWIMPQPALLGMRGHVDIEFTVERDGSLTSVHIVKPSGTSSFDRAAQNALTSSRLLSLPSDFGPTRVTMQVSFFYNEEPQGS
jgi:TonB family protein